MAQVRIELNSSGVQELLHEVGETVCAEIAQSIAASCGSGYESDTYNAGSRTVASAYAATDEAGKDNLENNTLLGALGNGSH